MAHTCHYPGCTTVVPPALWGCKTHWYSLPHELRNKLWGVYRPGQEEDKNPSKEYIEVAGEIQQWIKENK